MARDWPVWALTFTVWAYWGTVILLVIYKRIRHGQRAGVFPKQRREKRIWLGVGPVFLGWNSLPVLAAVLQHGPFSLPGWADSIQVIYACRCIAAVLAAACYLATLSCWLRMGRNWSMAIVPGQKTELVTGGLFGWVRHPIYSLSILLMVCSVVAVATVPMLLIGVLHIAVMHLKAMTEEKHLTERLGSPYVNYCCQVGRFIPRLRTMVVR